MAVTITAADVAEATGADETTAARLLPVAGEAITEYLRGGSAPQAVENEAALLFVGYFTAAEGSGAGALMDTTVGPLSARPVADHGPAFRRCGAAGLLTRYRRRRGGAI